MCLESLSLIVWCRGWLLVSGLSWRQKRRNRALTRAAVARNAFNEQRCRLVLLPQAAAVSPFVRKRIASRWSRRQKAPNSKTSANNHRCGICAKATLELARKRWDGCGAVWIERRRSISMRDGNLCFFRERWVTSFLVFFQNPTYYWSTFEY